MSATPTSQQARVLSWYSRVTPMLCSPNIASAPNIGSGVYGSAITHPAQQLVERRVRSRCRDMIDRHLGECSGDPLRKLGPCFANAISTDFLRRLEDLKSATRAPRWCNMACANKSPLVSQAAKSVSSSDRFTHEDWEFHAQIGPILGTEDFTR